MVETSFMEAGSSIGFPAAYLRLARPKQWTKNGFVLAGVVFAGEALEASSVVATLLAFDVLDVVEDRKHPAKRLRPIASGEVSARAAVV